MGALSTHKEYGYIFDCAAKLCAVLKEKYTLGVDTRVAYRAKDKKKMRTLLSRYERVLSATEVGERRKMCECGEYISEEIPMLFDEDSSGGLMDSNDNSSNVKDSIIGVNFGCSGALGSNMVAVLLGGSVACLFIKKRKND